MFKQKKRCCQGYEKNMLWISLLIALSYVDAGAIPESKPTTTLSVYGRGTALAAQSRQNPLNGALTGLFAPPFIVMVSMGALAHTMGRFVTDVAKYTSRQGVRRRKKKKKPNNQEPIKPFPPLQVARPPPPPPAPVSAPQPAAVEGAADAESSPTRFRWWFG